MDINELLALLPKTAAAIRAAIPTAKYDDRWETYEDLKTVAFEELRDYQHPARQPAFRKTVAWDTIVRHIATTLGV